jgi:hypothetical protein
MILGKPRIEFYFICMLFRESSNSSCLYIYIHIYIYIYNRLYYLGLTYGLRLHSISYSVLGSHHNGTYYHV